MAIATPIPIPGTPVEAGFPLAEKQVAPETGNANAVEASSTILDRMKTLRQESTRAVTDVITLLTNSGTTEAPFISLQPGQSKTPETVFWNLSMLLLSVGRAGVLVYENVRHQPQFKNLEQQIPEQSIQ